MLVLGIETSGRAGSVALHEDGVILCEIELNATGRRHARTLIPEIQNLFSRTSRNFDELDGVAVSLGPGSFTGLRVGIVCAKTLTYATGCKLIGVDTFAAVASQSLESGTVWIVDDALRGDVFAGRYRVQGAFNVECLLAPTIVNAEELKSRIEPSEVLSGPGIEKLSPVFNECHTANVDSHTPMARTIAKLGSIQLANKDVDDPWTLKPVYLRRSAAEEKLEAKNSADAKNSC